MIDGKRMREALHMMDEVETVPEREFKDHGSYCSVVEPSSRDKNKVVLGYSKTHIIFTKNAMNDLHGLQIIRFSRIAESTQWELAANPYSGISLTPEEWGFVMRKALGTISMGAV
jgi:hypothetical protein